MRYRMLLAALVGLAFASQPLARSKKDEPTVQCGDGTTSKAGRGACSHHGGVVSAAEPRKETKAAANAKREGAQGRGSADRDRGASAERPRDRAEAAPPPPRRLPDDRERAEPPGRVQGRAPGAPSRPDRAGPPTARCRDGSTSYAAHHAGACSSHGGVAEWLDQGR